MRNSFVLVIILLCAAIRSNAQDHKIFITPDIKDVTVFLNRAQLNTIARVDLKAGTNEIRLENQTIYLDPKSIQVSGKGSFTILSVEHEIEYLKQEKKIDAIQELQDSINHYSMMVDYTTQMNEVLNKEEQLILANQKIKGQNSNLTAKELEDMADFFKERLEEIREEIIDNKMKIRKLTSRLNNFTNQRNEYNKERTHSSSTIIVKVSASNDLSGTLQTTYISSHVGWTPSYDMRSKDTKSPVQLSYKAQVYQNTGYDWNNVHLTLSTTNPSIGGTKPELSNWYVDIYNPIYHQHKNKAVYAPKFAEASPAASKKIASSDTAMMFANKDVAYSISDYTNEVTTTLSVNFDIAIPYTIISGGKGKQVDIKNIDLPTIYEYAVVPKLDLSAFLLARIINWDGFNILSGEANVYFEGTYVGKTYIDAANSSDTLDISLGRDTRIVVERNTITNFTSKKFIGTNRKEEYGYELVIRNTKKDSITITVEDQYPISKNSQLLVELIETSGAVNNVTTGALTWRLPLAPTETKKLILKYSVKYPKDKKLSGI